MIIPLLFLLYSQFSCSPFLPLPLPTSMPSHSPHCVCISIIYCSLYEYMPIVTAEDGKVRDSSCEWENSADVSLEVGGQVNQAGNMISVWMPWNHSHIYNLTIYRNSFPLTCLLTCTSSSKLTLFHILSLYLIQRAVHSFYHWKEAEMLMSSEREDGLHKRLRTLHNNIDKGSHPSPLHSHTLKWVWNRPWRESEKWQGEGEWGSERVNKRNREMEAEKGRWRGRMWEQIVIQKREVMREWTST